MNFPGWLCAFREMIHLKQGADHSIEMAVINIEKPTTEKANLLKSEDKADSHFNSCSLLTTLASEVSFRGGVGVRNTENQNYVTSPCFLWETWMFISFPNALFNFGVPTYQIWSIKLTASFRVEHHTSKWAQAGAGIVLRNVRFTFHSSSPSNEWIRARKQTILASLVLWPPMWGVCCKEKYLSCLSGAGSLNGPPIKQHHKGHFTAELAI